MSVAVLPVLVRPWLHYLCEAIGLFFLDAAIFIRGKDGTARRAAEARNAILLAHIVEVVPFRRCGGVDADFLHGSFEDLLQFQSRCFPDELIEMERTSELWVRRKTAGLDAATLVSA